MSGDHDPAGGKGIGRRVLIKRAAAAGALVWSAPVVLDSLASPAGAMTINYQEYCYKVQYNWKVDVDSDTNLVTCLNAATSPDQVDTGPCKWVVPAGKSVATTDPNCSTTDPAGDANTRYESNQITPGQNCCKPKDLPKPPYQDNEQPWWSCWIRDLTAGAANCIDISYRTGGVTYMNQCGTPAGGFSIGDWIEFTIDQTACPDCWFADAAYVMQKGTAPGCSGFSVATGQTSPSVLYKTLRFTINASNGYPIYFKAWVGCNLTVSGTDQYVPNTQCPKDTGTLNTNMS